MLRHTSIMHKGCTSTSWLGDVHQAASRHATETGYRLLPCGLHGSTRRNTIATLCPPGASLHSAMTNIFRMFSIGSQFCPCPFLWTCNIYICRCMLKEQSVRSVPSRLRRVVSPCVSDQWFPNILVWDAQESPRTQTSKINIVFSLINGFLILYFMEFFWKHVWIVFFFTCFKMF